MTIPVFVILAVAWLAWVLPFLSMWRGRQKAQRVDRRARWGIVLEAIAYALLWQGRFWRTAPQTWRIAVAIVFFVLAIALAWSSTRALGRQWRVDAGLNPDHELVTTGAYRFVRHPIYASMLCMLLGTGFAITPYPLFAAALVLFIVGTEVRVRVEDALLASRFGEDFHRFRQRVPAYIPLLR